MIPISIKSKRSIEYSNFIITKITIICQIIFSKRIKSIPIRMPISNKIIIAPKIALIISKINIPITYPCLHLRRIKIIRILVTKISLEISIDSDPPQSRNIFKLQCLSTTRLKSWRSRIINCLYF